MEMKTNSIQKMHRGECKMQNVQCSMAITFVLK